MIKIDWDLIQFKGDPTSEEAKKALELTSAESMMSSEVEELSEDLKRENDDEIRQSRGKTSVAFIDLQQVSTAGRLATLVAAFLLLFFIGSYFYKMLFVKEADPFKLKRESLKKKREESKKQ